MTHIASAGQRSLVALALVWLLPGCSILSPVPLWELGKAGASAATSYMANAPGKATGTVFHSGTPLREVCIEFNRDCQVGDIVPALQSELQSRRVASRVYDSGTADAMCPVWLRYTASLKWGMPALKDDFKPYVDQAQLSLQTRDGQVIAVSRYELDDTWRIGQWATTRTKLAPVVAALLTGME